MLWEFVPEGMDMKTYIEFEHDPECTTYGSVYRAWKAAGQDDQAPTVAICKSAGKWAVGFGGAKNGMRAVKLAMALTFALDADPGVVARAAKNYPSFGKLCKHTGINF